LISRYRAKKMATEGEKGSSESVSTGVDPGGRGERRNMKGRERGGAELISLVGDVHARALQLHAEPWIEGIEWRRGVVRCS
jgi:hypothetical protein